MLLQLLCFRIVQNFGFNLKMGCLSRKRQYLKKYVIILNSQGIPIRTTSKLDCHCLIRAILNLASDVAIT